MNEEEIKSLVAQREQARQAKDFATADALRDQLRKGGVEIYDKDKYAHTATNAAATNTNATSVSATSATNANANAIPPFRQRQRQRLSFVGSQPRPPPASPIIFTIVPFITFHTTTPSLATPTPTTPTP